MPSTENFWIEREVTIRMTTRLVLGRHGNTFGPLDTPTRVGARTDLPLVESGQEQAKWLGVYLRHRHLQPHVVFSARLQRSYETARLALEVLGCHVPIIMDAMFDEIDYGPDENKTDAEVVARIGRQALADWDTHGKVPDGWQVQPETIMQNWLTFGERCRRDWSGKTTLVVTSNGIARFAPRLIGVLEEFAQTHGLKMATGAVSVFRADPSYWVVEAWNVRPQTWLQEHGKV